MTKEQKKKLLTHKLCELLMWYGSGKQFQLIAGKPIFLSKKDRKEFFENIRYSNRGGVGNPSSCDSLHVINHTKDIYGDGYYKSHELAFRNAEFQFHKLQKYYE